MTPSTKRVRELIGENEIEEAIGLLLEYLENYGAYDLLDQTILQKSRWADYKRKHLGGFSDDRDINEIRSALLDIARAVDKQGANPQELKLKEPEPRRNERPPPPQYLAQCHFNGDPNAYYVTPGNQIVMVNPMTNFSTVVANRMASINPAFAWIYMFPNGFFYSIDHSGGIWGLNAFGMPVQMGYVQQMG